MLLTDIDDQKRAEALLAGENRIFEMVARGLPLAATLDARCTCVENLVFGWNCRTLLIESSSSRFRQGAAPSLPPSYNTILDGCSIGDEAAPPASAALFKRQVIVSDLASESRWDASGWRELALSHGLRSCVSTPIMSGDQKVLGTLDIYRRESGNLDPLQLELIGQFIQIASIAIERALGEMALNRSETFLAEGQHLTRVGTFSWRVATDEIRWSEELYRIFEFDNQTPLTPALKQTLALPWHRKVPPLSTTSNNSKLAAARVLREYHTAPKHLPSLGSVLGSVHAVQ